MEVRQKAVQLYAALPRNLRAQLYGVVMADPEMPFRDGPDNSYDGRYFIIATGDYTAPAAQQALDEIIEQLPITPEQRAIAYQVYVRHLSPMVLQNLRRRRPANPLSNNNNAVAYRKNLINILGEREAAAELANPELIGAAAMNRRRHLLKMRNNATYGGRRSSRRRRRRSTRKN